MATSSKSKLHPPDTAAVAGTSQTSGLKYVQDIKLHDVLLGRGSGPNEHAGNKFFRELIQKQMDEFSFPRRNRKAERKSILQTIIRQVKEKEGRFLRRLSKSEARKQIGGDKKGKTSGAFYEIVDDQTAADKTKQAFRYAKKRKRDGTIDTVEVARKKMRTSESSSALDSPATEKEFKMPASVYLAPPLGIFPHPRTPSQIKIQNYNNCHPQAELPPLLLQKYLEMDRAIQWQLRSQEIYRVNNTNFAGSAFNPAQLAVRTQAMNNPMFPPRHPLLGIADLAAAAAPVSINNGPRPRGQDLFWAQLAAAQLGTFNLPAHF
jgi:hypothetical protein